jgi:hypothetical protein
MKRTLSIVTLAGLTFLGACSSGERFGSGIVETATPDGRWRDVDGTLIRSYNVSLQGAYDAVAKLAKDQGWTAKPQSGAHEAEFDIVTADNVAIGIDIWAPAGKATDIGVRYGKGDRFQSVRIFELLEKELPGDRIMVNAPG